MELDKSITLQNVITATSTAVAVWVGLEARRRRKVQREFRIETLWAEYVARHDAARRRPDAIEGQE